MKHFNLIMRTTIFLEKKSIVILVKNEIQQPLSLAKVLTLACILTLS